jgi:DNA (cytosine-5)-methyltransferase 1
MATATKTGSKGRRTTPFTVRKAAVRTTVGVSRADDGPAELGDGSLARTGQLNAVSLFSGAGGLDLGLVAAGMTVRACVEIDPFAQETLRVNWDGIDRSALFTDITEVEPRQLMSAADLGPTETFLLAGGPPCQSFSSAGLRRGVNDGSGEVVHHYFQMVKSLKPRFFLFENVRGLLSAAIRHRPLSERKHAQEVPDDEDARLGSVMDKVVLKKFKALGYEVVFGILNSADYGTPQVRHRVFLLGSRDREFGSGTFRKQTSRPMTALDLVPPIHHRLSPYQPLRPWRTLRDGIGHMSAMTLDRSDTYTYSDVRAAIFRGIPPGRNWTYVRDNPDRFPPDHLATIMGGGLNSGGGKEGYWRRLSWDRPAPTLTAQPQQLATSLCHPEYERPLSIPEYAALQDFPPDYQFVGPKAHRYRQIGNAVPINLAAALGRAIVAVAENTSRGLSAKADHGPAKRQR